MRSTQDCILLFGRQKVRMEVVEPSKIRSHRSNGNLLETTKASELEECHQFARFVDADTLDLDLGPNGVIKVDVFVEDWIPGITLAQFVRESSHGSLPRRSVALSMTCVRRSMPCEKRTCSTATFMIATS